MDLNERLLKREQDANDKLVERQLQDTIDWLKLLFWIIAIGFSFGIFYTLWYIIAQVIL